MSLKFSSLFAICFSFFLLFNTVRAFNITQILSQYPDFSTFSNYLTQTQLAGEINSRQTITVLVVENGNMSPLSGKPNDVIKNTLSVHVILDYFDVAKLQKLQNKTAMLTTLFQSSGLAKGQQGFLNVAVLGTNSVAFGSAVPGSSLGSNLVKSVSSQPYNISVLQVSNIIVPGNTNSTTSPPTPPSPVPVGPPKTSPTPASNPNKPPPSKAPAPSTSNPPPSKAPAPSTAKPPPTNAPAASMAKPPAASAPSATPPATSNSPVGGLSPTTADGPAADSPTLSPPAMDGPIAATPVADGPFADAPSVPKSDAFVINAGNNLVLFALILILAFVLV